MKCKFCGMEIEENHKQCPDCLSQLSEIKPVVVEKITVKISIPKSQKKTVKPKQR